MKHFSQPLLLGCLALLVSITMCSPAAASGPRNACGTLSLAEVRSLVGSAVSVFEAGSSPPTTRVGVTISTCTYVMLAGAHPAPGRSAKFSLMWGDPNKLEAMNAFYIKRHIEASAIKGGVFVVAWVSMGGDGKRGNWDYSQRLLAAVLKKL
ncbi:MAG: hypothetical protein ABR584_07815 [Candidatus Baltobacteraceae bacterium]